MRFKPLRAHSTELLRVDLLRFIASVGIVWHHSHEFLYPVEMRSAVTARSQALALFVDMFFAISGFVISYVYANRPMSGGGYARFLQRRVGRLIPLHWLTFAVTWLLLAAVVQYGFPVAHAPDLSARCSAEVLFLLHSIVPCGNGVFPNGVSWSISIEMALYLAFPLLMQVCRGRIALPVWSGVLLVAAIWMLSAHQGLWDETPAPLRGVLSFSIGMVIFLNRARLALLRIGSATVFGLTSVTIFAMLTGAPQALILIALYVLVAAAVAADARSPAMGVVRTIAPLGQMTYSIYMWHSLIITVVINIISDKMFHLNTVPMALALLVCYGVIMLCSYLSWGFYEEPARRYIDKMVIK